MPDYQVHIHVRRIWDHAEIHTSTYQADAPHIAGLLHAIDPDTARSLATKYGLKPEDTTHEPRKEAHP